MPGTQPDYVQFDSKDNLLRAQVRGPFKGLNTTASPSSIDYLALTIADNANIEENGSITKRNGYTSLLTSGWSTNTITQGIEYKNNSGTVKILLAGHDSGLNSGAFGTVDAAFASVSNVSTGLSNNRPSLFQFNNLAFYLNGVANFLYDGTTTRQIGITAPTNAPTNTGNTNGSLTVGAVYSYAYTYYNSVTGAESSPSPLLTTGAVPADPNDGFIIGVTAGDATTADTIRLYRSDANGAVLFLDTTAAIGATSINSTKADAGLGKELELDNSRYTVFGEPRYGTVNESRVFLTGFSGTLNRVIFSGIYSEGPHPESYPVKNYVDCISSKGYLDSNIGLGIAGDTTILVKKFSVGRLEKIGLDSTTDSTDPVQFSYREISRATTGVSHFAGCNVYGEYIWLGIDNIYGTDGTSVRTLGDSIRTTLKGYSFSVDDSVSAFNDIPNKRIFFTVKSDGGQTEPNYQIVGHYFNYPEIAWTIYKPTSDTSTYPGIPAGCLFEVKDFDGVRRMVAGNNKLSGKLYYLNNGTNDDGKAIYFRVKFAPISFGLDGEEKLYVLDKVKCQGNGASYNLLAKSFYDDADSEFENQNLSLASSGSVWGAFNWGVGLWGGVMPLFPNHYIHKKAYRKALQLENTSADQPITIFSYETDARPTAMRGT